MAGAALLALVVLLPAGAFGAPPANDIEAMNGIFERSLANWRAKLRPIATGLLGGLFSLEAYLTLVDCNRKKLGWDAFASEMFGKAVYVAIVTAIFWIPGSMELLVDTFRRLGALVGGGPYDPVQVVRQADRIQLALLLKYFDLAKATVTTVTLNVSSIVFNAPATFADLVFALIALFAALPFLIVAMMAIKVAFMVAATQMILTDILALFAISLAVFFTGFASFRMTAGMTDAYFRYVMQIALRLFFINFFVGVGVEMAGVWMDLVLTLVITHDPNNNPFLFPIMNIPVVSGIALSGLLYGYLTWTIPSTWSKMLGAEIQLGVGKVMRKEG